MKKMEDQRLLEDQISTVLHIIHKQGGGIENYVNNFNEIYKNYKHIIVKIERDEPVFFSQKNINLIIIHSLLLNMNQLAKNFIEPILECSTKKIMIIHDYSYVFPKKINLTKDDKIKPFLENINYFKFIIEKMDMIYFNSRNSFLNYNNYLTMDKYEFINNVPDINIYNSRKKFNSFNNKVNGCIIGNLKGKHKGSELADELIKEFPNINFTIIGEFRNINSHKNVYVTGKYENKDIYNHMKNISFFLFLSTVQETYSYTLSLALNTGLPIIYNNLGAYIDRLENYDNCYPFDGVSELKRIFINIKMEKNPVHFTCKYDLYKNMPEMDPYLEKDIDFTCFGFCKNVMFLLAKNYGDTQKTVEYIKEKNYDIFDYIFLVLEKNFYVYQDYKVKVLSYKNDIYSVVNKFVKTNNSNILITFGFNSLVIDEFLAIRR